MSIEVIPAEEVIQRKKRKLLAQWPSVDESERLLPLAKPVATSKFQLEQGDTVFCVGSCFAREMEASLARLGFQVSSQIRGLPRSKRRELSDTSHFNKYTIPSILNEIRWALDPDFPFVGEKALIENGDGFFEDFQLSGAKYSDSWEDACRFREGFNHGFRAIAEADVVVISLGLSEAWFDKESGLYLNLAPKPALVDKYPGRFELRVLDYEESLTGLEEIYRLLSSCSKKKRIMITVSPVPLLWTFRKQDILLANSYSKAVLRAAVEAFSHKKEDVSYFPCYEFVTHSNPLEVWGKRDLRHVEKYFVRYMMSSVLETFIGASPERVNETRKARASALLEAGFEAEAVEILRSTMSAPELLKAPSFVLKWNRLAEKARGMGVIASNFKHILSPPQGDDFPLTGEEKRNQLRFWGKNLWRRVSGAPAKKKARERGSLKG